MIRSVLMKKENLFIIISTVFSFLLIYGLLSHLGFLSGVKDFRYPYRDFIGFVPFLIPFLFALLIIIIFHYGYRKGSSLRHLFFLIIASYLFQMSVLCAGPHGMAGVGLVISDPAVTSYFQPASELKTIPLDRYPEMMGTFVMHAKTHPPGPVLLIRGILKFFEHSPMATSRFIRLLRFTGVLPNIFALNPHTEIAAIFLIGFLLPFLSVLSAIPIYWIVSRIDSRRTAFVSSTLFLIAPAMALFSPGFDQIYALLTMTAFAFFFYSLTKEKPLHALIAGLIVSLATFFHFLSMSIILLFMIFGLLWFLKRSLKSAWKEIVKSSSLFVAGFILPFILLKLIFNFSIIQVFRKAIELNRILVDRFPPPGLDFLQFSIFLGIPVFILLLFTLFDREFLRIRMLKLEAMLTLSLFVLLIALSISGHVRVETGRLWIFLFPFAAAIGGIELEKLSNRKFRYLLIVVILIILTTFVLRGTLAVLSSPIYGNF